jgi:hypothetical protein
MNLLLVVQVKLNVEKTDSKAIANQFVNGRLLPRNAVVVLARWFIGFFELKVD